MHFWNKVPFLRLVIPLISGILVAIYTETPVDFFKYLLGLLFFALLAFTFVKKITDNYRLRILFGFILNLFLFLSGYESTIRKTDKFKPEHYTHLTFNLGMVIAEVADPPVEKEKTYKVVLNIIACEDSGKWISTTGKAIVYLQKDSLRQKVMYGDKLLIGTKFKDVTPPQNPSEFDYRRYLSFHQIHQQAYVKSISWKILKGNENNGLRKYAYVLRDKLLAIFKRNHVAGDELAVASALMLGYKDGLDQEIRRAYSGTGAMHVLSVSGLHVGIIFIVFNSLLFFLDKIKYGNIIKAIILILLLWAYALLTELSPSVLRSAVMFSFIVAGQSFKRYTNIYNTLASSAFFLLFYDPYLIMEIGFQLSYMAVIGIVYLQPKIYNCWETDYWLLDKVWAITAVSIAAQLITFPLGLLYFHQFPNYFLLSNVPVIFLTTLIIYLGVLLIVISPLDVLAGFTGKILSYLTKFLNESVFWIEKLPFSVTQGSISILETGLIYIFLISGLLFLTFKKTNYLMLGLTTLAFLILLGLLENLEQIQQKKFIIYNLNNTSAYNFIDGRDNLLFSDTSLINDPYKLLFHVHNNWINLGVGNENIIALNEFWSLPGSDNSMTALKSPFFVKENFMQFYNKRIAFINAPIKEIAFGQKLKLDYVVLSKNVKTTIRKLLKTVDCKTIIIDSSNSVYKTQGWLNECAELNMDCYSVTENGAFLADLNK